MQPPSGLGPEQSKSGLIQSLPHLRIPTGFHSLLFLSNPDFLCPLTDRCSLPPASGLVCALPPPLPCERPSYPPMGGGGGRTYPENQLLPTAPGTSILDTSGPEPSPPMYWGHGPPEGGVCALYSFVVLGSVRSP